MKRIVYFMLAVLLLAGALLPAGVFADGDHPITLTITCENVPELEGDGTIPDLLFTIRNESEADYTLINARLTRGYEDREMLLTEFITVPGGESKEFHLTDVPVSENQLNRDVTYKLSWEENETVVDPETDVSTIVTHERETTASFRIEKFIVPELSVSASCDQVSVRYDEPFTVVYTIRNDTEFDMSGLKLVDPEQSMLSIPLPDSDLTAGQTLTVPVEYKMGALDMSFAPQLEYIARRREMTAVADRKITVESVFVDLTISAEERPAAAEGTTFAITVRNNGNRTVTKIRVYDEINTLIGVEFDLGPEEFRTLLYTVQPAVSSDRARTVRFHLSAIDYLNETIRLADPNTYTVVPYVSPDSVRLGLSVVLQSPYYDENGKLCASIQFNIRNNGDVKIFNAVLSELTLFGKVVSYPELRRGDTYFTQIYQLDGVTELKFRLDAYNPAGELCSSDVVRLDLSRLRELADRKHDPVLVYTTNPYLQDLDTRYSGVLRVIVVIALIVAAACGVFCIVLFAVEMRIKSKLPAEFEEDMERVMRSTKRRTEKQLFSDAPTEQFGYTAPIKLRNYGELTEEEAKARRELYRKGLEENLRKEGARPERPAIPPSKRDPADETRITVMRRTPDAPPKPAQTGEFRPPKQETAQTGEFRPPKQETAQTGEFRPPKQETAPVKPVTQRTPAVTRTVMRTDGSTKAIPLPKAAPAIVPAVLPKAAPEPVEPPIPLETPEPPAEREPQHEFVPEAYVAPIMKAVFDPVAEPEPVVEPEPEAEPLERIEPEPAAEPKPEAEPLERIEPEPVAEPEPEAEPLERIEPEPAPAVRGPVRILEKAIPARRPIVPLPVKRMNG